MEYIGDPVIPKTHLTRVFGVAPKTVSKYLESGDPNKDCNAGVSIDLYQDNTIQYAAQLFNLFAPGITGSNLKKKTSLIFFLFYIFIKQ